MMLTSDTPEQTTLSGELAYLVACEEDIKCQSFNGNPRQNYNTLSWSYLFL